MVIIILEVLEIIGLALMNLILDLWFEFVNDLIIIMNRVPKIQVISASSDSESENSSSFEEENLDGNYTEVDRIAKTHQDLKRKLTYQIMQFRNSSRELMSDSCTYGPTKSPEFITLPDSPDPKIKNKSFQDIMKLFVDFTSTKKELENAKSNVQTIEGETNSLHEKLRTLEDRIKERRASKQQRLSGCSCEIY